MAGGLRMQWTTKASSTALGRQGHHLYNISKRADHKITNGTSWCKVYRV